MTFYVTDITDPWNSIATFPGFSLEEAAEAIESGYDDNCIPMTSEERKKFLRECNKFESSSDYKEVYNSMKDTFLYNKFLNGSADSKISYSFWVTSAYDTHSTIFVFGADTVGSYDFNLNRIAKKLGEKHFYNYATGKGKRIKDFSTLVKILQDSGVRNVDVTKEDLINAANENSYYIRWKD